MNNGFMEYENEDGDLVRDVLFTFDPVMEEQNRINAKNADLIFKTEFFYFNIKVMRDYGLSYQETALYGFIYHWTHSGAEFFVSNKRLAVYFGCHYMTVSKAIRSLAKKGLIKSVMKKTSNGSEVRKLSISTEVKINKPVKFGGEVGGVRGRSRAAYLNKDIKDKIETKDIYNESKDSSAELGNFNPLSEISLEKQGTEEEHEEHKNPPLFRGAPPLDSAPREKKEYGNPEINQMLSGLKAELGIDAFADASVERFIGKHCVDLMNKLGRDEFKRRLHLIVNDSFKRKNCNRIRYLYNEIKAFIEPRSDLTPRRIVNIS